jgi:GntR family transcriptional regulator
VARWRDTSHRSVRTPLVVCAARPRLDDSADPPHRQLAAFLRQRIEAGEITARLPGEKTLQQEYGLALATVRKAVKVLRDEGLVRTVPGWGTYVAEPGHTEGT